MADSTWAPSCWIWVMSWVMRETLEVAGIFEEAVGEAEFCGEAALDVHGVAMLVAVAAVGALTGVAEGQAVWVGKAGRRAVMVSAAWRRGQMIMFCSAMALVSSAAGDDHGGVGVWNRRRSGGFVFSGRLRPDSRSWRWWRRAARW